MTSRFVLDEGLPKRTAAALRESDVEAWHVTELGLQGAADPEVLAAAHARQAVLVCFDSDFHQLLAQTHATRPSVIRIRIEGLGFAQLAALIMNAVKQTETLIADGAAVSVTEHAIRARRLPLNESP